MPAVATGERFRNLHVETSWAITSWELGSCFRVAFALRLS